MKKYLIAFVMAVCAIIFIFPFTSQAARLDTHTGMMKNNASLLQAYQNDFNTPIGQWICHGDWFNIVSTCADSTQYVTYPITVNNSHGTITETHYFNGVNFNANSDSSTGSFSYNWNQGIWYNHLPSTITYNDDHPDNYPLCYVSNNNDFWAISDRNNNNQLMCGGTPVMYADYVSHNCYYNNYDYINCDWHWARASQGWSTAGLNQGYNAVYIAGTDESANYTTGSAVFYYDNVNPYANTVTIQNLTTTGYDVYVYGVGDATSGVRTVQFPTWINADQSDLRWVTGTDLGGGVWYYHVDYSLWGYRTSGFNTDVYVYDNAGNQAGYTGDRGIALATRPQIAINPIWHDWTKNNVNVNISCNDVSGISYISYSISSDGGNSWSQNTYVYSSSTTITFSSDGDYEIFATAYNNLGYSSYAYSGDYYIDKTPPTVLYFPNSCTWQNTSITVGVNPYDSVSGVKVHQYRISNNNGATWGAWSSIVYDKKYFTIKLSSQGQNVIQTSVTDNAGNVSIVQSGIYYIDTTPPTVTYSPYSGIYSNSISVTVTPADTGGSGVKQWRYKTCVGGIMGVWSSYYTLLKSITINNSSDTYIVAEITDNAGNVSIVNSGIYTKLNVTVSATLDRPLAKQGQQITFTITTTGKPNQLEIDFPIAISSLDSNITNSKVLIPIVEQDSLVTTYKYVLSLTVPKTLDDKGNRILPIYTFNIIAKDKYSNTASTQVTMDVQFDLYHGIRTRMR